MDFYLSKYDLVRILLYPKRTLNLGTKQIILKIWKKSFYRYIVHLVTNIIIMVVLIYFCINYYLHREFILMTCVIAHVGISIYTLIELVRYIYKSYKYYRIVRLKEGEVWRAQPVYIVSHKASKIYGIWKQNGKLCIGEIRTLFIDQPSGFLKFFITFETQNGGVLVSTEVVSR